MPLAFTHHLDHLYLCHCCVSATSNHGKTGQARLFAGRDPREQGGKLNSPSQADMVEVVCLGGKEYLWYKAPRIDVAILRGSTADTDGNVSFERECFYADALNQASCCVLAQILKNVLESFLSLAVLYQANRDCS